MFEQKQMHHAGEPKVLLHAIKLVTWLTWCTSVIVSVYFTVQNLQGSSTIRAWDQNYLHPTNFTMDALMGDVFWVTLFALQFGYFVGYFLQKSHDAYFNASVDLHFIGNNLFHVSFVFLFIHSLFIWAEILLLINFANLTTLYFRYNLYSRFGAYPKFLLTPVMSLPLAWNFVAIYWNGAIMVPQDNQGARIVGYVIIWGILVYGAFHVHHHRDYVMALGLSFLAAAIGVAQLNMEAMPIRWILPFIIMGALFSLSAFAAVVLLNEKYKRTRWDSLADRWPKALESGLSSPSRLKEIR